MTKEEIKQWLRSQIDSSVKIQDHYNMNVFYLCYNNSYLRALKFSKINGKPVNEKDFKGGDILIRVNTKNKEYWYFAKIRNYLKENYSKDFYDHKNILKEVINEYEEYKGYKYV